MLFLTHTTVSVPALTGAIMCMGVATANSVLVISFAREQMEAGKDARAAALEAGFTRLRPVLMTALAMIIGMIPMALGLGESGEQNAPLGRAVIGGLVFATVATLFFVPTVFAFVHRHDPSRSVAMVDQNGHRSHGPPNPHAAPAQRHEAYTAQQRDRLGSRIRLVLWILLILALILAVWGIVSRLHGALGTEQAHTAGGARHGHRRPSRSSSGAGDELVLPGIVHGLHRGADLCAHQRLSQSWYTDIGTHVKKGQLLAEIETPEVDRQLSQAQADLATAQANLALVADHQRALAGAAHDTLGSHSRTPTRRPATRRPRRRSAARPHENVRAAAGSGVVQARGGAVRRRRDGAQYRYRHPHQCRRVIRHRTVPGGRYHEAAHLRAGARGLCRVDDHPG